MWNSQWEFAVWWREPKAGALWKTLSYTGMNEWTSLSRVRLCDPMDCGPPGSSVHGILQARILEWVAIPFPRASSRPRDWTCVSCIAGRFSTIWATREAHCLSLGLLYIFIFNWRIIALQCCFGFFCTTAWLSHKYMWGHEELDTTEKLHCYFSLSCIGEGNGNPLQCSCLESPRDGGAWWAAVCGVTQSQTQLMWLSNSSSIYSLPLEALSHPIPPL